MKRFYNKKTVWIVSLLMLWLPFSNLLSAGMKSSSMTDMPCHQQNLPLQDQVCEHCAEPAFSVQCECCDLAASSVLIPEQSTDQQPALFSETLKPFRLKGFVSRSQNPPDRPPKPDSNLL